MSNLRAVLLFWIVILGAMALGSLPNRTRAEPLFLEAESFVPSSPGWKPLSNDQTRRASRVKTLWGADGPGDATAAKTITLGAAGRYRVWVRYMQVAAWRGPFQVGVSAGERELAAKVFDLEPDPHVADWEYTWQSLDADLPAGDLTITLAKHQQKNCVGYVRHVDCLLLTTDMKLEPSHLPYGPQTFVRVTLGKGYDRPVYVHVFADHYRSPWYAHLAIGRDGVREALAPPAEQMLRPGERTAWCNLTSTVYHDSGAALNLSIRHSYHEKAPCLRAMFEFGRGRTEDEVEVVKTFEADCTPSGLVIIAPPDLESPENVGRLQRDRDFAEQTGRLADAFPWPQHGKRPVKIPFLVSANIGGYELPVDAAVTRRERQTLDYFGFNGSHERILHGLWFMQGDSYCRPDVDKMQERVKLEAEQFQKSGRRLADIAACMLMDEPTGQAASFLAQDEACRDKFRQWLRSQGLQPQDLLVANGDEVRPVAETERDQHPALHYYTQRFRTRALGDFMATQRRILEQAYGRTFPTLVNFSDGAVYHANFYSQGVDYFELLDADDQNAIWGEDWANNSSTYQCAAFNVDLMRAAARRRGQSIGHYLIAHARRTPWDVKLKATSETARGVRMWMNFCYGPSWGSHEGGPPWTTHLWYARPELWAANADITREIGAVEDWLLTARTAPAEVAVLYSSSSDIWTMGTNLAYGFDRMHTWLALSHAQVPLDIVPEREVAGGRLDGYKVCYLSGPNLTRAAAAKLKAWVEAGGTLWLTAGAAERDEFNRPLDTLTQLLPAQRGDAADLEPYQSSGRFLSHLPAKDTVAWNGQPLEVLSVRQPLAARDGAVVPATFHDGSPAVVSGRAGAGRIIVVGFLPALAYIKIALAARAPLERQVAAEQLAAKTRASAQADQPEAASAAVAAVSADGKPASAMASADRELLSRSHNPWQFPAGVRDLIVSPVREAGITPPLTSDTPLIDAVQLPCEQGVLIALANYTLQPQERVGLQLRVPKPVQRVESVRRGPLHFEQAPGLIRWTMPLDANDFVMVHAQP